MQDDSAIEVELATKLKNDDLIYFQNKSYFDRLADVFGDRCVLWWIIPVQRIHDDVTIENELNMHFIS